MAEHMSTREQSADLSPRVNDADHAVLDAEWHKAFDALRAAGLEADADHPIAARYRSASDAVNHANRSRDFFIATGRTSGSYITATKGNGPVHWRTDRRHPVTVCGVDFTGTYATEHYVITGGAFTCPPCKAAWQDSNDSSVSHDHSNLDELLGCPRCGPLIDALASTEDFPQTEAEARACIHGVRVWFGHECGTCMDVFGVIVWAAQNDGAS